MPAPQPSICGAAAEVAAQLSKDGLQKPRAQAAARLRGARAALWHRVLWQGSQQAAGHGDSYVVDPAGEIIARTRRQVEDFLVCDLDMSFKQDTAWGLSKSAWSFREFAPHVQEALRAT